jgi:eukaryotic-like serine/threonine-protein kinase
MIDVQNRLQLALSGRYVLKRELGRGGMAVVYLAEDVRHQRQVAIKLFDPEVAGAVGHERFLREIAVAAHLTHPHILPLYDSGEADGLLYYVMPFIQGETLRERLRRAGQLSLAEAVRIAGEVADALGYAHGQGLVHRDIKPENVMLTSGHALVMDFGICRAVGEASEATGLTRAGLTLGTPAYMSPEQWTAPERVSGRSDVYSLGCVLYEMLVGEPPFSGSTTSVLLARHTQQEVPSVRLVRPDLPESVEQVVRYAMAKVPEERFSTAHDFDEALQELITNPGFTIPGATRPTLSGQYQTGAQQLPPPKPKRLRRVLMAVIPLVVLALGYAAYVGLSQGIGAAEDNRIRLIVLPFESRNGPEREYFADGVTEEITSRLASLNGLAVIARTTTMQYKGTTKDIKQIGQEVNVSYVVEGSVLCRCKPGVQPSDDDSLLVRASLINVADGVQVFTHDYPMRLAELFSVQSTIAQKIAETLQLALLEPDKRRLQAKPTDNLAAYDVYLRGNSSYYRSWERKDVEGALALYEQAAQMDPNFAAAYARIAQMHAWMHRLHYDPTESRLTSAKQAVDRALALNPDLPEAHISAALYWYWGRWDYNKAMDEFLMARRLRPNDEEVTRLIGHIRRRQGKWPEAIAAYKDAAELDPRSHLAWFNLGDAYVFTRDYATATRELEKASLMAPDFFDAYLQQAHVAIKSSGNVAEARRILDETAQRIAPAKWRPLYGFWLFGMGRMVFDTPERIAQLAPGKYGMDTATYHIALADISDHGGNQAGARAQWDSARVYLERVRMRDTTEVPTGELALAYAALGRSQEAVTLGRQAAQAFARDAYDGVDWVVNLARVYMMVGDRASALNQLELAMRNPSRISAEWLRKDPVWRPLWNEPGFKKLISDSRPVAALKP